LSRESALAVLRRDPRSTCVVSDFDGTLAAIVDDPATAHPLPGAVEVLRALVRKMGRVAVVSGRPAGFLAEHLIRRGADVGGLRLVGLYGLETVDEHGRVSATPEAEQWRDVVASAAARAERDAPPGGRVEPKGLSVTLHWREHPELEGWAMSAAGRLAGESGLVLHPARRSVELRPPLDIDKGTAVGELVSGFSAACFLGDDLGDLPAFAALDRLASDGTRTVKVAAAGADVPVDVVMAADLVVEGPVGALEFLRALAG